MALSTVFAFAVFLVMATYVQNAAGQQSCAGIPPVAMDWSSVKFEGKCHIQRMVTPFSDNTKVHKCINFEIIADKSDPTQGTTVETQIDGEQKVTTWKQPQTGVAQVIQNIQVEGFTFIGSIIYNNSNGDYVVVSCPGKEVVENPLPFAAMLCTKSQFPDQSAIDTILQDLQTIGFDTQYMKPVSQDCKLLKDPKFDKLLRKLLASKVGSQIRKALGPNFGNISLHVLHREILKVLRPLLHDPELAKEIAPELDALISGTGSGGLRIKK